MKKIGDILEEYMPLIAENSKKIVEQNSQLIEIVGGG